MFSRRSHRRPREEGGDRAQLLRRQLGQGRCLLRLSRPTEAAPLLQHAREIFEGLNAAPALAETDVLLASAAWPPKVRLSP
jgi:hypothetical protein